jgi:hypothetical protein
MVGVCAVAKAMGVKCLLLIKVDMVSEESCCRVMNSCSGTEHLDLGFYHPK